jgi:integrase
MFVGRKAELNKLNKSLPNNVTSEMGLELGDLADMLRELPEVQEYLKKADNQTFYSGLDHVSGGETFRRAFVEFIDKYGIRCPGEIDITSPRWYEAPTQLNSALFSHIQSLRPGEHRKRFEEGKKEAEMAGNKAYSLYYSNTSSLIDEIDPDTRKLSFQDYIDEHWWPLNKNKWKTTTMVGYRKKLDNYLIPSFGACSLEAIKSERLQMYFDKLYLEEQTAICTVNDLRSLTAQIFKFAVTHRHLRFSPMDAVTPPNNRVMPTANKNRQTRDAISNDILEKIFERFPEGTATYIPCKLSVLAGLRLGEAFGLAWHDIDFDNHWIYVTRQVQMRTKEYALNAREIEIIKQHPELSDFRVYTCNPKDESKRIVPMVIELEELLKREYEKQQQNHLFLDQLYKKYYYTKATDPYLHSRDYTNFNIKKLNSLEDYEDGMVNDKGIGWR